MYRPPDIYKKTYLRIYIQFNINDNYGITITEYFIFYRYYLTYQRPKPTITSSWIKYVTEFSSANWSLVFLFLVGSSLVFWKFSSFISEHSISPSDSIFLSLASICNTSRIFLKECIQWDIFILIKLLSEMFPIFRYYHSCSKISYQDSFINDISDRISSECILLKLSHCIFNTSYIYYSF